jgi:hypothetical protein
MGSGAHLRVRQVREKPIFFVVCVKKRNLSCEKSFFRTGFFLHTPHDKSFFMKQIRECIACEDVHVNLLFQLF